LFCLPYARHEVLIEIADGRLVARKAWMWLASTSNIVLVSRIYGIVDYLPHDTLPQWEHGVCGGNSVHHLAALVKVGDVRPILVPNPEGSVRVDD